MDILVITLTKILTGLINWIDSLDLSYLIFVVIGLISIALISISYLDNINDEEELNPCRTGTKLPSILTSLAIVLFPLLYSVNAISIVLASILTIVSLFAMIINFVMRIIEYGGRGIVVCVLYFFISTSLFILSSLVVPLVFPALDAMRYVFSAIIVVVLTCVILFKTKLERWSTYWKKLT